MADGVDFSIDGAAVERASDQLVRSYLSAATYAVATTTKALERKLEAATQSAVPGRLWRAWQSSTFPKSGPAQDPVGTIWIKGGSRTRGAIQFWTEPGEVRGKRGQYLAVPLPSAGGRGRNRNLTPGEWERAHGIRLQFIYRQGKPSLLAAVGGTLNGRSGNFRPLTRGRSAKGRGGSNPQASAVVPIFILLPVVRFRNAFAIEPMVQASQRELVAEFLSAVRGLS